MLALSRDEELFSEVWSHFFLTPHSQRVFFQTRNLQPSSKPTQVTSLQDIYQISAAPSDMTEGVIQYSFYICSTRGVMLIQAGWAHFDSVYSLLKIHLYAAAPHKALLFDPCSGRCCSWYFSVCRLACCCWSLFWIRINKNQAVRSPS